MQYHTRHLVACVAMRYAGMQLQPGERFHASPADARYLTRNGKAMEPPWQQQQAPELPLLELPSANGTATTGDAAPAAPAVRRRTRAKLTAQPAQLAAQPDVTALEKPPQAAAAADMPRHDMRFDPPPPPTGVNLDTALLDDEHGSDLLTRTRGVL